MKWWSVPREWEGHRAFIVAGGVSAETQNVARLKGEKVVAINCAGLEKQGGLAPFADILYFGDPRFWDQHRREILHFPRRIATTASAARGDRIHLLKKRRPPGLSDDPDTLVWQRTNLHGAINLVVHLGANPIILLGADGRRAADGRAHHHKPHKWPQRPKCWEEQRADLLTTLKPLKKRGIKVLNASPGTAWADLWPVVTLDEVLGAEIEREGAQENSSADGLGNREAGGGTQPPETGAPPDRTPDLG